MYIISKSTCLELATYQQAIIQTWDASIIKDSVLQTVVQVGFCMYSHVIPGEYDALSKTETVKDLYNSLFAVKPLQLCILSRHCKMVCNKDY